jgi:glycosyltransferase involved in cell wall biosynthesis
VQASPAVTRVLMILDSFSFGGAEILIAELGRHSQRSLEVSVASLAPADRGRNDMVGRLTDAGLQPFYLSVRRLLDPAGFIRLVRTLRRSDVDVVHAHLDYSAILVPLAARLARKPVVTTLHVCPQRHARPGEWVKERLSARIPARLGRLVFVSQHAYDEYARVHGPARSTWRVIPNGVDLDRFAVRRIPRSDHAPVWAVVAALRPDKNHADLIRAWADVVSVHPKATLLIVGDGPSRGDIERAVSAAGIGESVRFLGRREDIPEILCAVDGVVSASVDEALPMALIEAGACSIPIVATDAGGTREIVVDGVTGRLVPVRDVPALTEALLHTIEDPVRAQRYGAAARALVCAKYSMTTWHHQLERLYSEVVDRRSVTQSPLTVAHVIHSLGSGGAEAVLVEMARAAPSARLRLIIVGLSSADIVGTDHSVVPQLRELGATVYEMHAGRYDLTRAVAVAEILRKEHVDIVHTHLKHADVVGGVAARLADLPSVSTLHVIDIPKSRLHQLRVKTAALVRRRLCSTVIAVSREQQRWYDRYTGAGVPVVHIPNGVGEPQETRDRTSIRAEIGVPADTLFALCVSLMRPEKGHLHLLAAMRELPENLPIVLAMAGDGPLLSTLQATVQADPVLCKQVRLLGFRRDIADLLSASDFVVHPSSEDALPTALISALAAARPIVATNVGGIPDVVKPGCGLLVEAGNPSALSAAIAELATTIRSDAAASDAMRRAARAHYEACFSAEVWAKSLRTVYLRAIQAHAHRARRSVRHG